MAGSGLGKVTRVAVGILGWAVRRIYPDMSDQIFDCLVGLRCTWVVCSKRILDSSKTGLVLNSFVLLVGGQWQLRTIETLVGVLGLGWQGGMDSHVSVLAGVWRDLRGMG